MTTTISGARMASALKIKDGSRSSVSPTSGTEPASPWTLQKGATFSARLTNFGKETFGFAKKSMPWLPDVNVPKALPISRFRATIFEILDNSASSIAAFIVYVIVMCFIMISIITFCMGTDPANRMRQERNVIDDADRALERVETAVVIAFTVEYLARLVTCTAVPDPHEVDPLTYLREKERHHQAITPADIAGLPPSYPGWIGAKNVMPVLIDGIIRLSSFIFSPLNVIDVAAVVPYYVQLIMPTETGSSLAILRVLRLARVLRVLRLSRRSAGFRLLSRTMELSMDALAMLAYIIALGVVLFGSMVFYCEAGEWDPVRNTWMRPNVAGTNVEESPFRSIPVAFWWTLVSITTVGYGDLSPTTACGRSVGSVVIVSGMLALAMPITIIGANFNDEFARYKANIRMGGDGFTDLEALEAENAKRAEQAAQWASTYGGIDDTGSADGGSTSSHGEGVQGRGVNESAEADPAGPSGLHDSHGRARSVVAASPPVDAATMAAFVAVMGPEAAHMSPADVAAVLYASAMTQQSKLEPPLTGRARAATPVLANPGSNISLGGERASPALMAMQQPQQQQEEDIPLPGVVPMRQGLKALDDMRHKAADALRDMAAGGAASRRASSAVGAGMEVAPISPSFRHGQAYHSSKGNLPGQITPSARPSVVGMDTVVAMGSAPLLATGGSYILPTPRGRLNSTDVPAKSAADASLAQKIQLARVAAAAATAASMIVRSELGRDIAALRDENAWLRRGMESLLAINGVTVSSSVQHAHERLQQRRMSATATARLTTASPGTQADGPVGTVPSAASSVRSGTA